MQNEQTDSPQPLAAFQLILTFPEYYCAQIKFLALGFMGTRQWLSFGGF